MNMYEYTCEGEWGDRGQGWIQKIRVSCVVRGIGGNEWVLSEKARVGISQQVQ